MVLKIQISSHKKRLQDIGSLSQKHDIYFIHIYMLKNRTWSTFNSSDSNLVTIQKQW